MIIQWLLVPAIIAAVLVSLRSRNSLRGQARRKLVAAVTLVAGVVAVIHPSILQSIADFVGIARGVDLILYGLALVVIYFVGSVSVRFREHESKVVLLTRAFALAEAERRLPDARATRTATPAPAVPYMLGVDAA